MLTGPPPKFHGTWDILDGLRAYSLSRTADGYLIECMPPAFTSNEIAGPGSVWGPDQPTSKHGRCEPLRHPGHP